MGFANVFYRYCDRVQITGHDDSPPSVLIIGPGEDDEEYLYWCERCDDNVYTIGPDNGPTSAPDGTHTKAMFAADHFAGVQFDVIWAAHVLEHAEDVGIFLRDIRALLHPDGHAFITVPPMKPEIVGGHVNLFNMGLLAYRLVLAGFDLKRGAMKAEGYNLFAHARRGQLDHRPGLVFDCGDIESLSHLFPFEVHQGFDGNAITAVNWK